MLGRGSGRFVLGCWRGCDAAANRSSMATVSNNACGRSEKNRAREARRCALPRERRTPCRRNAARRSGIDVDMVRLNLLLLAVLVLCALSLVTSRHQARKFFVETKKPAVNLRDDPSLRYHGLGEFDPQADRDQFAR